MGVRIPSHICLISSIHIDIRCVNVLPLKIMRIVSLKIPSHEILLAIVHFLVKLLFFSLSNLFFFFLKPSFS